MMGAFDDLIPGGNNTGAGGRAESTNLKQAEDARAGAQSARQTMRGMGFMYDIAGRYPGGIPSKVIDAAKAGVGATDPATQDYRLFDAMSKRAAIGQAKMLAPVSNTDVGLLMSSGPNPALSTQNNRALIDMDFPVIARTLLQQRMKANWIERYGSLSAKMKNGKTFGDAYRQALQMPSVKSAMRPVSGIMRDRAKAKAGNVVDFNDLPD